MVAVVARSADARALKQSGLVPSTMLAANQAALSDEAAADVADALSPYNPNTAGPLPADAAIASDDDPVGVGGNNGPTSASVVYPNYGPAVAVSTVSGGYRPRLSARERRVTAQGLLLLLLPLPLLPLPPPPARARARTLAAPPAAWTC